MQARKRVSVVSLRVRITSSIGQSSGGDNPLRADYLATMDSVQSAFLSPVEVEVPSFLMKRTVVELAAKVDSSPRQFNGSMSGVGRQVGWEGQSYDRASGEECEEAEHPLHHGG